QEEGHHGRDEVRVGDLPRARMGRVAALLHLLDDDGLELFRVASHYAAPTSPGTAPVPRGGAAGLGAARRPALGALTTSVIPSFSRGLPARRSWGGHRRTAPCGRTRWPPAAHSPACWPAASS